MTAPEERSTERIARNNAVFREANERILEAADAREYTYELVPFICECEAED